MVFLLFSAKNRYFTYTGKIFQVLSRKRLLKRYRREFYLPAVSSSYGLSVIYYLMIRSFLLRSAVMAMAASTNTPRTMFWE